MNRRVTAFTAVVALAGALLPGGTGAAASPAYPARSTTEAPLGVPVRDSSLTFDGFRLTCGSGKVGDEDSMLDPGFVHCTVGIGVVNVGSGAIELDPFAARIRTNHGSYRPWRRGMKSLFLDDQTSLFRRSIPPGGGGLGALIFLLKRSDRPVALELHEAQRSPGATLLVEKCAWSDNGGSCRERMDNGEPGNAYPRGTMPGVRYPHALDVGQPTCFDRRQWWPVRGTEGTDFSGQGTVELDGSRMAPSFHDNSGAVVALRYGHENMQDERVCG